MSLTSEERARLRMLANLLVEAAVDHDRAKMLLEKRRADYVEYVAALAPAKEPETTP